MCGATGFFREGSRWIWMYGQMFKGDKEGKEVASFVGPRSEEDLMPREQRAQRRAIVVSNEIFLAACRLRMRQFFKSRPDVKGAREQRD
jgi:hypothetical protein